MKVAVVSLFLGALTLCAQEKPSIQLPAGSLLAPAPMVTPGIQQLLPRLHLDPRRPQPGVVELKGKVPATSKVCSVPLLDAHADANDPGIAMKPWNGSAPMPQAKVPAPACEK